MSTAPITQADVAQLDYGHIEGTNRILCVKKNGKVVGEWESVSKFRSDELKASEELEEKLHPWR
jgi:hypothetical protein